jgi:nucleotide-binding universal stress UspA family protein
MRNLSFSKILVPFDFSERSEEAARYAKRFAAHFQSELILLHVVEPVHFDYAMVEPLTKSAEGLTDARRSAAKQSLDTFVHTDLSGAPVRTIVSEGDAAEQIVSCSKAENVSVLVMPTQGRSRIRQFIIGSVTAKVLHDSECPVLTGCHLQENADFPDFQAKTIICAVDFGTQSETVLKWGARLAEEFKASVTAMNVVQNAAALDDEQRDCLERRLRDMAEATGLHAKPLVEFGEPNRAVAEAATRLNADLLIIGRGSDDSQIGRLRAQAYNIVRQSPCPVLSV